MINSKNRFIRKVARIILGLFGIFFFVGAVSTFSDTADFIKAEKVKTTAVIHEDENHVKTYNFSANPYGVSGKDPFIKNIGNPGEKVTIYYQKNKPYVVYRQKDSKLIWFDGLVMLGWSIFFSLLAFDRLSFLREKPESC